MAKKRKREQTLNIPNTLTTLRVIITLIILYGIFSGFKLTLLAVLFIVGMLTDWLDGSIARRFNKKTRFGRKFDMIADRFLMIGTAGGVLIAYFLFGTISSYQFYQILAILSREIVGFPFLIIGLFLGNVTPKARIIGKATTVLQAITFPAILLSLSFSIYLTIPTLLVGFTSGVAYAWDIFQVSKKANKFKA